MLTTSSPTTASRRSSDQDADPQRIPIGLHGGSGRRRGGAVSHGDRVGGPAAATARPRGAGRSGGAPRRRAAAGRRALDRVEHDLEGAGRSAFRNPDADAVTLELEGGTDGQAGRPWSCAVGSPHLRIPYSSSAKPSPLPSKTRKPPTTPSSRPRTSPSPVKSARAPVGAHRKPCNPSWNRSRGSRRIARCPAGR